MDFLELPAALVAAGARVEALGDELPDELAALILDKATPPRATGALDASGRVEAGVVVFGGGVVDYAAVVESINPYLTPAVEAAMAGGMDYAAARLLAAVTL